MSEDEIRQCRICNRPWTFTASQARWLRQRIEVAGAEFHRPSICPDCAAAQTVRRNPGMHVEQCSSCGFSFAAPGYLNRKPIFCRACLQERTATEQASIHS